MCALCEITEKWKWDTAKEFFHIGKWSEDNILYVEHAVTIVSLPGFLCKSLAIIFVTQVTLYHMLIFFLPPHLLEPSALAQMSSYINMVTGSVHAHSSSRCGSTAIIFLSLTASCCCKYCYVIKVKHLNGWWFVSMTSKLVFCDNLLETPTVNCYLVFG